MIPSSMPFTNKTKQHAALGTEQKRLFGLVLGAWCLVLNAASVSSSAWAAVEREPVTLSVVAINPSDKESKVTTVKIELPTEITPKDVLDKGELEVEFNEDKGSYYLYKESVALAPKETRVFEVRVKDVWFVPKDQLDSLKGYTKMLMGRLEKSDYAATAKPLSESVLKRLDEIASVQDDESLSRKSRIGAYRHHLEMIATIKEDLARMEKLLSFTGGVPVPEMMQESALKSDAPSTTTTWMVIFLVLTFVGLLAGLFFFTWHRRGQVANELAMVRKAAFPGASASQTNGGSSKETVNPPR